VGQPTHRNATVRTRLQTAYARAHKNWLGGYPLKSEAQALAQDDASYLVGGNPLHSDVAADGTVDRAVDAAADDRAARALGATDGSSIVPGNAHSKGT
jgi:hypothetical protein